MAFFEETKNKPKIDNSLWTEHYRPKVLKDYVGNDHLKEKVAEYIESSDIPHLLFYGKSGTGKCLDYTEEIEIEMELSDDEYEILKKYEI
jgi:Holliday junction resolvasome RuvABC ATP-dependent DNA helicase subunit